MTRDPLASPTLAPWTDKPVCEACGADSAKGFSTWYQGLKIGLRFARVNVQYCGGSHPPGETKEMFNLMSGQKMGFEVSHPCYGLFMPHLHIHCNDCHNNWFMELYVGPTAPHHKPRRFWQR